MYTYLRLENIYIQIVRQKGHEKVLNVQLCQEWCLTIYPEISLSLVKSICNQPQTNGEEEKNCLIVYCGKNLIPQAMCNITTYVFTGKFVKVSWSQINI